MKRTRFQLTIFLILADLFSSGAFVYAIGEMTDLQDKIKKAPTLEVETLSIPIRSTRVGPAMLVPNPDSDSFDLLQWYYKGYSGPTTVFMIDLGTGQVKQDSIPLRRQIYLCGNVVAPDGKLYMATPDWDKGMELYVYDPAANALTNRGVIVDGLVGEKRPMTIGTDGMIYGTGSYRGPSKVGAYQLNPWTGVVTNYGPLGPDHLPNACWSGSIAADDRYIYIASGMVPWHLVAYDRINKTEKVLMTTHEPNKVIDVLQDRYGCWARIRTGRGSDKITEKFWLYRGQLIKQAGTNALPPWPWPRVKRPWVDMSKRPKLFLDDSDLNAAVPDAEGRVRMWYRPYKESWKSIDLTVPVYPIEIVRLTELWDGRLFGSGRSYKGHFIYDPLSNQSLYLGSIPLSHYTTALHDNKIHMSGYPSGKFYIYAPDKQWTVGNQTPFSNKIHETDMLSNPRLICSLREYCGVSKIYDSVVGIDDKIYFGGRWARNGNGGGLAWWDTNTEQAGGMWKEFSNYQISYMTSVDKGRYIVISTTAVEDVVLKKPRPKQGKLFVFDTSKGEIIREIAPIPNVVSSGLIVGIGDKLVLGMTDHPNDSRQSILYKCNVLDGDAVDKIIVPYALGIKLGSDQRVRFDYRLGPEGKVWTYVNNVIVKIDPEDMEIEIVGKIDLGGKMAFTGKDLYLSGSEFLRRVPGIAG